MALIYTGHISILVFSSDQTSLKTKANLALKKFSTNKMHLNIENINYMMFYSVCSRKYEQLVLSDGKSILGYMYDVT